MFVVKAETIASFDIRTCFSRAGFLELRRIPRVVYGAAVCDAYDYNCFRLSLTI